MPVSNSTGQTPLCPSQEKCPPVSLSEAASSFVARQPILDRAQRVFGYELLFRSSPAHSAAAVVDGDAATSEVLASSMFAFGIKEMLSGRRGFINFTRDHLFVDYAGILDPRQTVVEVLEDVVPDEDVVQACLRLKASGFLLALDDFCLKDLNNPLVAHADIIKVDFRLSDPAQQRAVAAHLKDRRVALLAEKVETRQEYEAARSWGYTLFQGYYFAKPELVRGERVPESKRLYHQLLCALSEPELDLKKIESAIKYDLSLTYKLLLFLNSARFGFLSKVESVRQAILLLGEQQLRTWVSLALVANMSSDKPEELIVTGAIRAHFCESLGGLCGMQNASGNLFLLGLFSVMDAVMGMPLAEVMADIRIDEGVLEALLGTAKPGAKMGLIFRLVRSYEAADWPAVLSIAEQLRVPQEEIPRIYAESLQWAERLFSAEAA